MISEKELNDIFSEGYTKGYTDANKRIEEKDKEIERLNKDLQTAIDICNNRQKEIVRLNNIIKRMEEDLKEMYLTFGEFSEEYTENKLKELKERK